MNDICTKEGFLKTVEGHSLTILKDDGFYRHLQCRRPNTSCMGFDIITWPGYLVVAGDMGEYVFQRIEDMLQFFRDDVKTLTINRPYWAEKCQASDIRGKIKEFSKEKLEQALEDRLKEYCEKNEELFTTLSDRVYDEITNRFDSDDIHGLYAAIADFEDREYPVFQDFWESNLDEYTYHYTWICFAIVWAIQEYDTQKAVKP